jgi:hypothetical protein
MKIAKSADSPQPSETTPACRVVCESDPSHDSEIISDVQASTPAARRPKTAASPNIDDNYNYLVEHIMLLVSCAYAASQGSKAFFFASLFVVVVSSYNWMQSVLRRSPSVAAHRILFERPICEKSCPEPDRLCAGAVQERPCDTVPNLALLAIKPDIFTLELCDPDIMEDDIELIMIQADESRTMAIAALKQNGNDIVGAIMWLTFDSEDFRSGWARVTEREACRQRGRLGKASEESGAMDMGKVSQAEKHPADLSQNRSSASYDLRNLTAGYPVLKQVPYAEHLSQMDIEVLGLEDLLSSQRHTLSNMDMMKAYYGRQSLAENASEGSEAKDTSAALRPKSRRAKRQRERRMKERDLKREVGIANLKQGAILIEEMLKLGWVLESPSGFARSLSDFLGGDPRMELKLRELVEDGDLYYVSGLRELHRGWKRLGREQAN